MNELLQRLLQKENIKDDFDIKIEVDWVEETSIRGNYIGFKDMDAVVKEVYETTFSNDFEDLDDFDFEFQGSSDEDYYLWDDFSIARYIKDNKNGLGGLFLRTFEVNDKKIALYGMFEGFNSGRDSFKNVDIDMQEVLNKIKEYK